MLWHLTSLQTFACAKGSNQMTMNRFSWLVINLLLEIWDNSVSSSIRVSFCIIFVFYFLVYWFSYMNSAINPFIYGFRTPIFKRLKNKLNCLRNSGDENGFSTIGKPMLQSKNNSPTTLPRGISQNPAMLSDSRTSMDDKQEAHPSETEKIPVT